MRRNPLNQESLESLEPTDPTGRQESSPEAAPWEDWQLDQQFFILLSDWTRKHPETSLDRILERINTAIDLGKEFFEAIPDGTFPARGLVKALAHILKLGALISGAKKELKTFAEDVVSWVNDIRESFERTCGIGGKRTGSRHLTRITWWNLEKMRNLINDICRWACVRLADKRWSVVAIKNRLVIGAEIAEFKARLSEAREIFQQRSIVTMSGGMDAILQWLSQIVDRQGQISRAIQKVHETQAEHYKHLIDRLDSQHEAEAKRRHAKERRKYVGQMLAQRAITNTTYVDQGKPPCDEDTRVDVLQEIMAWVDDRSPASQNFLWLTGDPGCGKSAVTASIARDCKDRGILWAQFFINRNKADTTDPNAYFPSIARLLALRSAQVESSLYNHLKEKPSIMDAMSSDQASRLFIDAVQVASRLDPSKPVVIVIDGLDETDRAHLKSTATIFSELFQALSEYPNAKIFISSRTEDEIRNPFARTLNNKLVKHLHLDTGSTSSIQDVAAYLRRRMELIVLENELNWNDWPGDERMEMLTVRASGLFIWAVTVAKFLQDQIDAWGTECLDDVLDNLNSDGMNDINNLYGLILSFAYMTRADDWAFETFRRLIGAIVVLQEPLCLEDLHGLLDLRRPTSNTPVDVTKFAKRLRTILVNGADAVTGHTVLRLHKSFFEFITDQNRAPQQFYVDIRFAHQELTSRCLRTVAVAKATISTHQNQMPGSLRYAIRFVSAHLLRAKGSASGIAIVDDALRLGEFKALITRSSNGSFESPLHLTLARDRDHSLIKASLDNVTFAWDSANGERVPRPNFRRLPVSVLRGHTQRIPSIAFQPNGRYLLSGSWDGAIYLWDIDSGRIVKSPSEMPEGPVNCVTFSSDGKISAAGTRRGDILMWNIETGHAISTHSEHQSVEITCLAFSSDGTKFATGTSNGTVRIFDIQPSQFTMQQKLTYTLRSKARSIAFSPDVKKVLACQADACLSIRDISSLAPLHQNSAVLSSTSIAYSSDGTECVTGSSYPDHTVRFWNAENFHPVCEPLTGHTANIQSVSYSADGSRVVSSSVDGAMIIWDVKQKQPIKSLKDQTSRVYSIALSSDGNYLASASDNYLASGSDNHMIHIWTSVETFHDGFRTACTAFSRDGLQTASISPVGEICHWNAAIDPLVGHQFEGDVRGVQSVAFSPDSSRLVVAGESTFRIWETRTRKPIASTSIRTGSIIRSIWFLSRKNIITLHASGKRRCWTETKGELVRRDLPADMYQSPENDYPPFHDTDPEFRSDGMSEEPFRWIPTQSGSALWAYVDSHIVRVRMDGSITTVQVNVKRPVEVQEDDSSSSSRIVDSVFEEARSNGALK